MDTECANSMRRVALSACQTQQDMFATNNGDDANLGDTDQAFIRGIDVQPDVLWDEQAVVDLHWLLLKKIDGLRDPHTPLEEKFELLRWIFTDPTHDRMPFSFASCLEVIGESPLSPTAYFGKLSPEEVREWIAGNLGRWFRDAIHAYPAWIQSEIIHHPDWVARQLEKNPQWINQQIKKSSLQDDLFS